MLSAFAFVNAFAAPAAMKFYTTNTIPKTGDIIELDLKADASSRAPVFTYVIKLEYDKDKLQFIESSYGEGFVPVTPNEVNDTQNGIIKRTAGYPNGLRKLSTVTKYKFKAIAPGKADVRITGESALDENNNDNGVQEKRITMTISGQAIEVEKNLGQNISLEFVGENSFDAAKVYNFSINHKLQQKLQTAATTSISLFDINGQEVLRQDKPFVTSDDTKLDFSFPERTLVPGKYSLTVNNVFVGQIDNNRIIQELTVTGESGRELGDVAQSDNVWSGIVSYVWNFLKANAIAIVGLIFIFIFLQFIYKKIRRYKRYDR